MPINVTPIPGLSDDINDIRLRTAGIVNEDILPNEAVLWQARGSNATDAAPRRPRRCGSRFKNG